MSHFLQTGVFSLSHATSGFRHYYEGSGDDDDDHECKEDEDEEGHESPGVWAGPRTQPLATLAQSLFAFVAAGHARQVRQLLEQVWEDDQQATQQQQQQHSEASADTAAADADTDAGSRVPCLLSSLDLRGRSLLHIACERGASSSAPASSGPSSSVSSSGSVRAEARPSAS